MKRLVEMPTYRVQGYNADGQLTHRFDVVAHNAREAERLVAELLDRTGQRQPERLGAALQPRVYYVAQEVAP